MCSSTGYTEGGVLLFAAAASAEAIFTGDNGVVLRAKDKMSPADNNVKQHGKTVQRNPILVLQLWLLKVRVWIVDPSMPEARGADPCP